MPTPGYYAYVIGDEHICTRIDVLCDNDEEVERCAQQLVDGRAIELWQEVRKVALFRPNKNHKKTASATKGAR